MAARDEALRRLTEDRGRKLQTALAFVVIFQRFLNDPGYFINDVSELGIRPR